MVLRAGREIKRVHRPVRMVDGAEWVVYKGRQYPLGAGNRIEVLPAPVTPQPPPVPQPSPRQQPTSQPSRADIPTEWDDSQKYVIEAAPEETLLVDAGPGTGKTAVACARVARLIDHHDISPSAIWFVSFTRTAVQEIRRRLQGYLQDGQVASAVKIATLDSHAWALHSGFERGARLSGGYEENIGRVTELIRSHEGVFEHLQSVAHVVIDEAQDVVGLRAELVIALIDSLPSSCGITLFSDEAQAIYGFCDEEDESRPARQSLLQRLRESGFVCNSVSLKNVRRTDDPRLREIFTDVRRIVLDPRAPEDETRLQAVRHRVVQLAHKEVAKLHEAIPTGAGWETAFVLFRRRADALRAASFQSLKPHWLRMSGLPAVVEPWIGVIFADFTAKRMPRSEFDKRWARVATLAPAQLDMKAAWRLLFRLAGESAEVISVTELRKKLSRLSPPPEVCRPDFGLPGPLFGTIHGSKGREADEVALMLPPSTVSKRLDPDEEARVLFVGATRARRELVVVKPYAALALKTGTGRACILQKDGTLRAQIEIGREHDLAAVGLVGREWFESPGAAHRAQQWLLENCTRMTGAIAVPRGKRFDYHVSETHEAPPFAVLEQQVNSDLFKVGEMLAKKLSRKEKLRPDGLIPYVRVFGARTFAAPADTDSARLHEPWGVSGFMLAPLVQAFTMIDFKPY